MNTITTLYIKSNINATYSIPCNHATGYASQHIWCLSQDRMKWEGCGRNGIRCKNGVMMEVGR